MRKRSAKTTKHSWRNHPMSSVAGCIDAQGEIRGRATKEIDFHPPELSKGKRWRWLIWSQDFHSVAPRTLEEANNRIAMLHLNEEEHFAVCDWLVRHGYADDSIMPVKANP